MRKTLLIVGTTINVLVNAFVLVTSFLLSSKLSDYYTTWSIPNAWLLLLPLMVAAVLFVAGVILYFVKKAPWTQFLVAAPLLINIMLSILPTDFLKTTAMKQLDERNARHMECLAKFMQEHPGQDSTGVCPFQ